MWGWVWKVCSAKSNRDLTWAGSDTSGRNAAARGAEEEEEREMGVELILGSEGFGVGLGGG